MNRLLIVDDNKQLLRLLNISLEKAGFEVLLAENGQQAYELYQSADPDLIISDIMMPVMDGIELCMQVRESETNPLIPFIFITSAESPDMEVKGYRAGADDYITKPIERDELIKRIKKLLDRKKKITPLQENTRNKDVGLQGNLTDITLVEIIQLIALNHRSGVLTMTSSDEQLARIFFEDGKMLRIEGEFGEGEEALSEIVAIKDGYFSLSGGAMPFDAQENVSGSTMNVLMEACRILDERQN